MIRRIPGQYKSASARECEQITLVVGSGNRRPRRVPKEIGQHLFHSYVMSGGRERKDLFLVEVRAAEKGQSIVRPAKAAAA